ncbi:MAG: sigma-70 region 4 domain-containing protein [Solirubrobacteraceae bacterium]|nr:sigma-70 region 4 domain-containing protein [Solirubrobacteraceae bacterium]
MSRLQTLPPDQRAVLQLLLQKDRSYDEIAQLLRLDGQTIRARAHAAVATLGPIATDLSDDQRGELTDYLLGEQSASARAATRAYLDGSQPARSWAREAAEELRPLAGDRLPEIPAEPAVAPAPPPEPEPEPDPEPAPAPAPVAPIAPVLPAEAETGPDEPDDVPSAEATPGDEPKRSSKIGGMLLIFGIGAAIAILIILGLRGFGGDDEPDAPVATTPAAVAPATTQTAAETETQPSSTSTTPTSTTPSVNAEVTMAPPSGGGTAKATATLITQSGQEAIAIAGQGLSPTTTKAFYGLWFANSKSDAVFLGYAPQVGKNGKLRLFDALPDSADPSQFDQIWLTREIVTEDTTTPTQPGEVALSGKLPG